MAKNKKGYSLVELIIVLVLISLMLFVITGKVDDFSKLEQTARSCVSYQDLVNSIENSREKPVEFKTSYINFKRDVTIQDACTFEVGNYKKEVLVSLNQVKEDVANWKLSPIQEVKKTPPVEESHIALWVVLGFFIIIILLGIWVSLGGDSSSMTDSEKEEAEKKFKSLKNQVLETKNKEKEEIKTSKKIYI